MNKHKKISIILFILILSFLLLLFYFFYFKKENTLESPLSLEESIKNAVSEKNLAKDNFNLTHVFNNFARGEIVEDDGTKKNIFLVSVDKTWKVIDINDGPSYCEKKQKIGFPPIMLSDCILQFPQAQKIDDVLNEKIQQTNNQEKIVSIIGFFNKNNDNCNCFEINSGDKSYIVSYDLDKIDQKNIDSLIDGEMIIIDAVVLNDSADGGEFIIKAEKIDIVAPEIKINDKTGDAILSSIEPPQDIYYSPNTNDSNDSNNQTQNNIDYIDETDFVIEEPITDENIDLQDSDQNTNQYTDSLDIDNSSIKVEIISDF